MVASVYDGEAFPIDLFMLWTFDDDISDDLLICIDALRWGKADLCKLIPDGTNECVACSPCGASNGRQRIERAHHTDALHNKKPGARPGLFGMRSA